MAKHCEACSALAPEIQTPGNSRRPRNLLIGNRIVFLCDTHADLVLQKALTSVAEVRSALCEAEGQRSLLDRRSPLDRRAFPPRPEGRRRAQGRRSSDVDSS